MSRRLQHGHVETSATRLRLPAREIEACVTAVIAEAFDDALALIARSGLAAAPSQVVRIMALGAATAVDIRARDRKIIPQVTAQVRVLSGRIEVDLPTQAIADLLQVPLGNQHQATVTITSAVRLTRTGRAVRLVQSNGSVAEAKPDSTLVKLIAKARHWWKQLVENQISITQLAAREGVSPSYATRIVRLAFLAPVVVDAILRGRQLASLDGGILTGLGAVPCEWNAQTRRLLPS